MTSKVSIYALRDPVSGDVKYVGATKNPDERLNSHIAGAANEDVSSWIESLSESGEVPEMEILDEVEPTEVDDAESSMIEKFGGVGGLLNRSPGGGYSVARASGGGTTQSRVPSPVHDVAGELKDERGFPTYGEAIRHMCQEGGFDV